MTDLQSELPFSLNSGSHGWKTCSHPLTCPALPHSSVQALTGLIWKAMVVLIGFDRVPGLQRQVLWPGQQLSCMALNYLTVLPLAAVISGPELFKVKVAQFQQENKTSQEESFRGRETRKWFQLLCLWDPWFLCSHVFQSFQPPHFHPFQVFVPDCFLLGIFSECTRWELLPFISYYTSKCKDYL